MGFGERCSGLRSTIGFQDRAPTESESRAFLASPSTYGQVLVE